MAGSFFQNALAPFFLPIASLNQEGAQIVSLFRISSIVREDHIACTMPVLPGGQTLGHRGKLDNCQGYLFDRFDEQVFANNAAPPGSAKFNWTLGLSIVAD